jgi:hypothetical protein
MNKFEVIVKSVPNNDVIIIGQLRSYTGQPVSKIKECISNGLPIYSTDMSYDEFYRYNSIVGLTTRGLISFLQKKNIDVIIEYGDKKYTLEEFVKVWEKMTVRKLLLRIRLCADRVIDNIIYFRIRIGKFNGLPLYF